MSATPGPWSVADRIVSAQDDEPIAKLYIGPNANFDARLIAAAPRMFAVIEKGATAGDTECIAIVEAVNGRG